MKYQSNPLTDQRCSGRRHWSSLFRPAILAAILAMQVSGCALLKPAPAPRDTFELSAPTSFDAIRGSTSAQILIKQPNALKSIDSDRIVVRTSPSEITYMSGAQWSDNVPRMVQAKLVEAFENTGATGATAKPGDGLVIDYQIISDIRRFEIDANGQGQAKIEISLKLLADRTGKVVESRIFSASAPVLSKGGAGAVEAFDKAFADLSNDIVKWVLSRV
ncbi:MAG: ABC transporter [Hyphomicrobiales bacterium]|nr:MAG: ABC transporter [Hyphomicrobiales bacterium]